MTKETAAELLESEWWKGVGYRDLAMFQMFVNRLCMPIGVFQEAMEKTLGRPVWTHEFGLNRDGLRRELLGDGRAPTMEEIINLIPAEKRKIVVAGRGTTWPDPNASSPAGRMELIKDLRQPPAASDAPIECPNCHQRFWNFDCPKCGSPIERGLSAVPSPGGRTLAYELHQLAMNTRCDPAKAESYVNDPDGYKYGHHDARHDIAEALIGHPALVSQPPSPADGELLQQSHPGDWPEDFPHENGRYLCRCYRCDNHFWGHKRRIVCKLCNAAVPASPPAEAAK